MIKRILVILLLVIAPYLTEVHLLFSDDVNNQVNFILFRHKPMTWAWNILFLMTSFRLVIVGLIQKMISDYAKIDFFTVYSKTFLCWAIVNFIFYITIYNDKKYWYLPYLFTLIYEIYLVRKYKILKNIL